MASYITYTVNDNDKNNNIFNLSILLAPPFSQPVDEQSSMIVSQDMPMYPGGHWQAKELLSSVHVPPFWQGLGVHSSTSVWQDDPVKPSGHSHIEQSAFSDPPFWHVNPHAEITET